MIGKLKRWWKNKLDEVWIAFYALTLLTFLICVSLYVMIKGE